MSNADSRTSAFISIARAVGLAALLAALAVTANVGMRLEGPRAKVPSFAYLPSPQFSRFLFPGLQGLGTSIAWSRTILYFADIVLSNEDPRYLTTLIRTVNALDPRWSYPYEFGGLVITDRKGKPTEEALNVLRDGIRQHPDNWLLRIYYVNAMQNGNIELSEQARLDSCVKILLPLSTGRIKAPEYAKFFAFTLLQKGGRPEEAMRKLFQFHRTVQDPLLQMRFEDRMMELIAPALTELGTTPQEFKAALSPLWSSPEEKDQQFSGGLLVALTGQTQHAEALQAAHGLLSQYRAFMAKQK